VKWSLRTMRISPYWQQSGRQQVAEFTSEQKISLK
jgi:hypothetical protein